MTATTSEHRKRLRKGRRVLCALASTLLACAGTPPPSLDDISTDLRIESLPDRVQVNVNGQWIGTTPAIVHLDRQQTYLIALATPGFQTRSFSGTAEALLKHRDVELVLVPNGFTGAIPPPDDAAGLAPVAETLWARKDYARSAEFWRRVVTLAPRNARGHRGLGSCYAKLGKDELAIREYAQYLFLDPSAPDAERVQKAIDAYRGGINVPTVPEE